MVRLCIAFPVQTLLKQLKSLALDPNDFLNKYDNSFVVVSVTIPFFFAFNAFYKTKTYCKEKCVINLHKAWLLEDRFIGCYGKS